MKQRRHDSGAVGLCSLLPCRAGLGPHGVATRRRASWMTRARSEHRKMWSDVDCLHFIVRGSVGQYFHRARGRSRGPGAGGRGPHGSASRAEINTDATASCPGRPFGTLKSADAPEDPSILAQSLDMRMDLSAEVNVSITSGSDVECGITTGVEQSYRGVSRESAFEGLEQAAILMVRHLADRPGM